MRRSSSLDGNLDISSLLMTTAYSWTHCLGHIPDCMILLNNLVAGTAYWNGYFDIRGMGMLLGTEEFGFETQSIF